jgi:hypothetical protein
MRSQTKNPGEARQEAEALFLDEQACARRYGISTRSWRRMVDAGHAPSRVQFGRWCRWGVRVLEAWESAGCRGRGE